MNTGGYQSPNLTTLFQGIRFRRGLAFGIIIVTALLAFEIFNYSTTDFALTDLLGDLSFMGVRWATILAIAFCGIDFAGIARLFTPEEGSQEPGEVWYLFGAWLLAATMNAMLTWWGVSLAIINHDTLGSVVIERTTLLRIVPIFVAVLVWLIRVLIIGTFSVAGERLFSQPEVSVYDGRRYQPAPAIPAQRSRPTTNRIPTPRTAPVPLNPANTPVNNPVLKPAPKSSVQQPVEQPSRLEPTYHPAEPSYHPISASPANKPHTGNHHGRPSNSRSLNSSIRR